MPNDALGQHLATSERFADEVGLDLAVEELIIYYANILMPVSAQVAKAASKVVELGWACDTIAPSHGVIWRHDTVPAALRRLRSPHGRRDGRQAGRCILDDVGIH